MVHTTAGEQAEPGRRRTHQLHPRRLDAVELCLFRDVVVASEKHRAAVRSVARVARAEVHLAGDLRRNRVWADPLTEARGVLLGEVLRLAREHAPICRPPRDGLGCCEG